MRQVLMVPPLNNPFDANRNQQPNRNSQQVKKEVSPAMNRFMRRVDVEAQLLAIVTPPPSIDGVLYKPL